MELVVGKYRIKESSAGFYAYNECVHVGLIIETEADIEFPTMDPFCIGLWMNYTAGNLLPQGVVSGGHLSDGSTTYVCRVTHLVNRDVQFAYYNADTKRAYYSHGSHEHTSPSMELFV